VTLLQVQQISNPSTTVTSSGHAAVLLAVVVLTVLMTAVLILASEWRQVRCRSRMSLADEAERWLREQEEG
jgi:hypothetical protein